MPGPGRVLVVGTGLLGTSLGLALSVAGVGVWLTDTDAPSLAIAMERGAGLMWDGTQAVDVLVAAVPPRNTAAVLVQYQQLNVATTYTHVASVQSQVQWEVEAMGLDVSSIVGGHPMAGSERTGVEHAKANLFEKAVWVLTPTAETPELAVNRMVELIEALGAIPLLLDASLHDSLLAVTSHLPHITAAALVHLFMTAQNENEFAQQLIATGWRDSTRVAAGSPEMWRDICLANAPAIARGVEDMIAQLEEFRDMVRDTDGERLHKWFDSAAATRTKHGYFPRR